MSETKSPQIKYDVFVSFRGVDIRRGFLSHLIDSFKIKKINAFVDDKLEKGDEIWASLVEAIEGSSISLIIFSQDYASSRWCLEELVKILECKHKYEQIVIPVFYDVEPEDVRHQLGSYKKAFAVHERKYENIKVQIWKDALNECTALPGFRSSRSQNDAVLVQNIVNLVETKLADQYFSTPAMDKFLSNMEREKPIRFTSKKLRIATDNYSSLLGSGGFGEVYKGKIDGITVAVKVLRQNSDTRIEEQFMAEVGTIGKIHHFNLVQLYGFCFERDLRALVYEYMENGSLDKYLFHENMTLGFEKLHEIAVGTAKGIAYLHEECQQRIIHYDIKPGNILLDNNFNPKVADFGLAKLCNRENTHITMTGGRGTPGYAAPEIWMQFSVTHKCDVYSFGMLLLEIIGKRKQFDSYLEESQQWFPKWVWKRFDAGELAELIMACGIEERNKEMAERMVKVALSCVQYRPESRPMMSDVVKMLEGSVEISKPVCPFQHMMDGNGTFADQWTGYFMNVFRWFKKL